MTQPTQPQQPSPDFLAQCDALFEKTGDTAYLQLAHNHRQKLKDIPKK